MTSNIQHSKEFNFDHDHQDYRSFRSKKQSQALREKCSNIQYENTQNISKIKHSKLSVPLQATDQPNNIYHIQGQNSIQLVFIDQEGHIKLNPKGLQQLQHIILQSKEQISLCSIVGKVKTGKSFLFNELIKEDILQQNKKDTFSVNHTLAPCTKGIWISKKNMTVKSQQLKNSSQQKKIPIIFLDTQGLGAYNSTQQLDYKLFLIIFLISDILCFNNIGPIDEQTLNNFSLGIEIAKLFTKKCQFENQKQLINMPKLLWILRDFSLQFVDKNAKNITPVEYLEKCLQEQNIQTNSNHSRKKDHKNKIRKSLKEIFPVRKCVSLVLPFQENSLIRYEFSNQIKDLKRQIVTLSHQNKNRNSKNPQQRKQNVLVLKLKAIITCLNQSNNKFEFPKIQNIEANIKRIQLKQLLSKVQKQCEIISRKYSNIIDSLEIDQKNAEINLQRLQQIKQLLQKQISETYTKFRHNFTIQNKLNQDSSTTTNSKATPLHNLYNKISQLVKKTQSHITKKIQQTSQKLIKNAQNIHSAQFQLNINYQNHIQNSLLTLQNVSSLKQLESQYKIICQECNILQNQYKVEKLFLKSQEHPTPQLSNTHLKNIEIQYLKRKVELLSVQAIQNQALKNQVKVLKKQNQLLKTQNNTLKLCTGTNKNREKTLSQSQTPLTHPTTSHPTNGYTQCTNCNKSFYIPYIIISNSQNLRINISKVIIKPNKKGFSSFQFCLVFELNAKCWTVKRKIKDFVELDHVLKIMFPTIEIPTCEIFVVDKSYANIQMEGVKMQKKTNQIKRQILDYLFDLKNISFIRNSRIFQKFIKINKQYLDLRSTD